MGTATVNTKFYNFDQNNSGGKFVEDDAHGVCETVIIEAIDHNHANYRLREIGSKVSGFDGFCDCCGERWPDACAGEGSDEPEWYGEPLELAIAGLFRKKCFIHLLDGSFKEHKFKPRDK